MVVDFQVSSLLHFFCCTHLQVSTTTHVIGPTDDDLRRHNFPLGLQFAMSKVCHSRLPWCLFCPGRWCLNWFLECEFGVVPLHVTRWLGAWGTSGMPMRPVSKGWCIRLSRHEGKKLHMECMEYCAVCNCSTKIGMKFSDLMSAFFLPDLNSFQEKNTTHKNSESKLWAQIRP